LGHRRNKDNNDKSTDFTNNRTVITEITVQKNWKEHVDRMSTDRIQERFLKYQPKGRRSLGISLK
jgi:predicted metal-dependent enzyme (double-stranded beta helix superfamily)